MSLNSQDILNLASQEMILGKTTVEEQIEFISDQIKDPFDSGNSNYFKKLRTMVNSDRMDEICIQLLGEIEDRYPDIEFDFSEYDQHLDVLFSSVYKFFVKNVHKLMFIFLREYIYSSKNRKLLTAEYLNAKLPTYPKEQYGKKEYYILITKLPAIINDIKNDDIKLKKFIEYIERDDSSPAYIDQLKDFIESGLVCDHGVITNLFERFMESDEYNKTMCKLQMAITQNIINPYLEDNGLTALRIPPIDPVDEETAEDDDE